jgi:hypothetical protein
MLAVIRTATFYSREIQLSEAISPEGRLRQPSRSLAWRSEVQRPVYPRKLSTCVDAKVGSSGSPADHAARPRRRQLSSEAANPGVSARLAAHVV